MHREHGSNVIREGLEILHGQALGFGVARFAQPIALVVMLAVLPVDPWLPVQLFYNPLPVAYSQHVYMLHHTLLVFGVLSPR